jgi:hypothetical protein
VGHRPISGCHNNFTNAGEEIFGLLSFVVVGVSGAPRETQYARTASRLNLLCLHNPRLRSDLGIRRLWRVLAHVKKRPEKYQWRLSEFLLCRNTARRHWPEFSELCRISRNTSSFSVRPGGMIQEVQ